MEIYFSNNLKLLLKKYNFQQKQLADELNIKPVNIHHYLKGNIKPTYENLYQICKLFNTTMEDILFKDLSTS